MYEDENTFITPKESIVYSKHLVVWSIHNFTNLQEQYEYIESADFPLCESYLLWKLQFCERLSETDERYFSYGIKLKSNFAIRVHIDFTVLNHNGVSNNIDAVEYSFSQNTDNFLTIDRFFQTVLDDMLSPNDTLTFVLNMTFVEEKVETKVQENVFGSLLNNEKFTDLTLHIGQQQINVHRNILAVRSEYFNNLLNDNRNSIVIDNIDKDILRIILQCIYNGTIDTADLNDNVQELLCGANTFKLNELKLICEQKLSETISLESAADILLLSHNNDAYNLKAAAKKFIITHFCNVELTRAWTNLVDSNSKLVIEMFSEYVRSL